MFEEVKEEFKPLYERFFSHCLSVDHTLRFYPQYGGYCCVDCGKLTVDDNFTEWCHKQLDIYPKSV